MPRTPKAKPPQVRVLAGPVHQVSNTNRMGISMQLSVRPRRRGVIYQRVEMVYHDRGVNKPPAVYKYTEAWVVNPRRTKQPVIDFNGLDAFMVCKKDIARFDGKLVIRTLAWFEDGQLDRTFRQRGADGLWGVLHGRMGHRRVPAGAPTLERQWTAVWKKGGRVRWKQGLFRV